MAQAPDIKTLLQFEDSVEPQIRAALIVEGVPETNVFVARQMDTMVTPSLAITLQIGATTGRKFNPPGKSFWMWDEWGVSVTGVTYTNRGLNKDSHAEYRAQMRYVMLNVFETINPLLDYHAFSILPTENGTDNSVDEENLHDISMIRFSGTLGIKRDAWPA